MQIIAMVDAEDDVAQRGSQLSRSNMDFTALVNSLEGRVKLPSDMRSSFVNDAVVTIVIE